MIHRSALALLAAAMLVVAAPSAWAESARIDAAQAQDTPAQDAPSQDAPATEPAIPPPVGFVNDVAGVLDESTRAKLEAFLDQVKRKTDVEFAVLIVPSTAPIAPTEYKTQVFQAWGLGERGEDSGLLMLVAIQEREVRFETGYGLEGTLPDGFQSRIFRQQMAPKFREGDYAGGIVAGVLACAERVARERGVTLEWDGRELRYRGGSDDDSPLPGIVIALMVFTVVAVMAGMSSRGSRRRGRGWRSLDDWSRWGGGWGGGFGGGGFGGGSGGGGFGGFGGGSSGGGGGGGKW